ncbi:MAG: flagellin N-terminal helical domain-containing protein, partial [Pseudomonadales bacterium]
MFQRMRELSVQAQSGTLHADDVTNLNAEFIALATEIDRIATDTTFNNKAILATGTAGAIKINVGADETDVVTFTTKVMELSNATV